MKLVAIEHDRCNEYDKTVFYVAPDEFSEEKIHQLIKEAQAAYLKAIAAAKDLAPVPSPVKTDARYIEDESLTVGEVKRLDKEYWAAAAASREAERKIAGSFEEHLLKAGFKTLYEYAGPEKVVASAYWGHRHGTTLDY